MKNLKTQFEIHYSSILSFTTKYKEIVSPYLKECDYRVENPDTFEEFIVLIYKDSNYLFEIRIDRMIFISEGDRTDLKHANGPFLVFFDIFEKINKITGYISIKRVLLAEHNLIEATGGTLESVKEEFKTKFLSSAITSNMTDFKEDYSVTLQYTKADIGIRHVFGPFDYSIDIVRYNLFKINPVPLSNYKKDVGIFMESVINKSERNANLEVYKTLNKVIADTTNHIKI